MIKMSKKIAILGSTGSIGTSTLEVIREHPEQFKVVALAAGNQVERMITQVREFRPKLVSMATKEAAEKVKREVSGVRVVWGDEGNLEVATYAQMTHLVSALVGSKGLLPTLCAIQAGKKVGLANKETLVIAGHLFKSELQKQDSTIIPIDSEHSALFQCLNGERREDVTKIIITASGGSFREWSRADLKEATLEAALVHPNWSMGKKITIDSATMMNKGFEVIEAHWLFGISYDQIEVVIHPQSTIHSMVEFKDGAVIAQLGTPDMKVPIQYALMYPQRLTLSTERLDFRKQFCLDFWEPDLARYPCLKMAIEAGRLGGSMPTVLNAANEIAVESFLNSKCSFLNIEEIVVQCLNKHDLVREPSLEEIQAIDAWARREAQEVIKELAMKI